MKRALILAISLLLLAASVWTEMQSTSIGPGPEAVTVEPQGP